MRGGLKVANVTVSVPDELKKRMEHMKAVNWGEVARQAFEETVKAGEDDPSFREHR